MEMHNEESIDLDHDAKGIRLEAGFNTTPAKTHPHSQACYGRTVGWMSFQRELKLTDGTGIIGLIICYTCPFSVSTTEFKVHFITIALIGNS